MLHLYHFHQQRCIISLSRFCQTQAGVAVDTLIGINKSKGICPSHLDAKLDKGLHKERRINTDIFSANSFKETQSAGLLSKPYVLSNSSSSSMIISYPFPNWSYTHIPSEASSLPGQDRADKGVLSDIPNETQLLKVALPFDEVPGPKILKLAAKFYSYVPLLGTHITTAAMTYFLNMLGTNLIWNRSATPFMHMFEKYGPIVRLQGIFGGNIVFVSHPEHIQTVFQNEGRYPVRSSLDSIDKYRTQYRNMQILGPFITSGPEWELLRKNLEATFGNVASQFHSKIENIATQMIARIRHVRSRQQEVPNTFNEDLYRWALENTCMVIFGKHMGLLDPSSLYMTSESVRLLEAVQNASKALRHCESGFQLWRFFETKQWHALVANCNIIDSVVAKYIRAVQNDLDNKKDNVNTNATSLLHLLLLRGELQPNDILTIMLDTFLIGVNAISHAFSFLLYHFSKNPWVQHKVFKEVLRVLPEKDSTLTYSSLHHLPFLKACLQESLRLQPPIPVITRVLPHDIALYSYRIPKGTYMFMTSHVTSLREDNFEDAHKFKPERWISDEENIHPFAAIPFGHGARACVGRRFAEIQLWSMAAKVIRNFHIEYHYGNIHTRTRLIAMPSKPLKFRFVERSK